MDWRNYCQEEESQWALSAVRKTHSAQLAAAFEACINNRRGSPPIAVLQSTLTGIHHDSERGLSNRASYLPIKAINNGMKKFLFK